MDLGGQPVNVLLGPQGKDKANQYYSLPTKYFCYRHLFHRRIHTSTFMYFSRDQPVSKVTNEGRQKTSLQRQPQSCKVTTDPASEQASNCCPVFCPLATVARARCTAPGTAADTTDVCLLAVPSLVLHHPAFQCCILSLRKLEYLHNLEGSQDMSVAAHS